VLQNDTKNGDYELLDVRDITTFMGKTSSVTARLLPQPLLRTSIASKDKDVTRQGRTENPKAWLLKVLRQDHRRS